MIVRYLRLRNFKKFRDATIDFAPGLNVIKGPNEAGKSTLHAALRMALFEKPTATAQEVKRAKSWQAEEMFSIGADIEIDGAGYRLDKDFAARKAALSGNGLTEPVTDLDAIQARLCDWLGCPNEKFFVSTVCVNQDEIAGWDAGEMAGHLQKVVTGGDVAAREALKTLRNKVQKQRVGIDRPAVRNGPIQETQVRLAEARAARGRLAEDVTRMTDAKKTVAEQQGELERIREDLAAKSELAEKNKKVRDLQSQLEALEKEYAVRQRAKAVRDELEGLVKEEESFAAVASNEQRIVELAERSTRLDEKRQILGSMMRPEVAGAPPPPKLPLLVPIVGAVVLVAGIAAGYTITPGMYVAALAGLGILAFGLITYVTSLRATAPADTSREVALRSEVDVDDAAIGEALAEVGAGSVQDATARLRALRDARERRASKESELRGATGGKTWEDFEEATRGLAPQIEQKKDVTGQLSASVLDPLAFEQVLLQVEKLETAREACEKRIAEAGYLITHSGADADELARLDDEITQLEEEGERLAYLLAVYGAAIEGIQQAERETMEKATDALQATVGSRVARVTGGRYDEVEVDEKDLSMRVRSDEKGDWATVDTELSRATRDQFYLAARLGLIAQLCGDGKPPLLLDDPFVTFDEERLARSMELLKEMAAERQVLFFTCHDDYERFADHVVDLGALREEACS